MVKNGVRYEVVDAPTPEDFRRLLGEGSRISVVAAGGETIEIDIEKASVPPDSDVVTFLGKIDLPASKSVFGQIDLMNGHGFLEVNE